VGAFKAAFGTVGLPTDNEIKSASPVAAARFANQMREGCKVETDAGIKAACFQKAMDAGFTAQCKVVADTATSKTAQAEAVRDTVQAALGDVCTITLTKSATDCLADKKETVKQLTGEELSDTEMIGRMVRERVSVVLFILFDL
jgi:hypothetical protein